MIKITLKFVWAMARHQWAKWRGFVVIAPPGVQAWRNRKCGKCAFNNEGECLRCHCLVLSKVIMALERCPIRLWNPVWIKRRNMTESRF